MGDSYKIKGQGDHRRVFDGDRLVGVVHRHSRVVTSVNINFAKGRGTLRKATEVWWTATRGETDERVRHPDGRVRVSDTLKGWAESRRWESPTKPEGVPRG